MNVMISRIGRISAGPIRESSRDDLEVWGLIIRRLRRYTGVPPESFSRSGRPADRDFFSTPFGADYNAMSSQKRRFFGNRLKMAE